MLASERAASRRAKWEIFKTNSLVEAVHKAKELSWGDNKIQVKGYQIGIDKFEYIIEPYEKDCGCSSLMKYADYFIPEDAPSGAAIDG